jgi:hypothetical protein
MSDVQNQRRPVRLLTWPLRWPRWWLLLMLVA